jgi:pimeloyl-ACP methyl ester carboxylesterase
MNRRTGRLRVVVLSYVTGCGMVLSPNQTQGQTSPVVPGLGKEFRSETATVNGVMLHYVRGGNGPAVILIHGFPQDWFEYRAIMPTLAKQFTVVAVDLRGIGGSTPASDGYDAANMAEDIYQLASVLKLEHVYIVGHDVGGHVAYAFVRRFPQITRGAMILDTPIPGIEGWEEIQGAPFNVVRCPSHCSSGRVRDHRLRSSSPRLRTVCEPMDALMSKPG